MTSATSKRCIVLLSGGMDSATCLAIAHAAGYEIYALSFDYGQRHQQELQAARAVAQSLGVAKHLVVAFDLRAMGGSALTDNIDVPKQRSLKAIGHGVPATYVPARNTVFLSFALAWAEVLDCSDIFIGVNALDYSGYPDCRREFIDAYEAMANTATAMSTERGRRVQIHAPLIDMTKAQIAAKGAELGVDFALTHTCYDPVEGVSCGRCDACLLRLNGFAQAGLRDPLTYANATDGEKI